MKDPDIKLKWLFLLLLIPAALSVVLIPVWLIQPFRPQTARSVEISYHLRSWSPIITTLAAIIAIGLSLSLWQSRRGVWGRAVLITLLIPLLAAVWFARENHFEWMFNPLPNARYVRASAANFVEDQEMVMAVSFGNEAVAYPVRQMAYHHVVNDVVGGKPITATY